MSPECQHIHELMDSYLSGELSVETNHLVLRHVGTCEACAAEVKRRQRLRALLAQSLDVPVDVDRVRQRVVHALDREQRSWGRVARWTAMRPGTRIVDSFVGPHSDPSRAERGEKILWGLAAALIVAVVAAQWLSRSVDASAYDDSAGNHVACALSFPVSAAYDSQRAARNLAPPFGRIAEAIGLVHGPYHVIDAHMCPYNGHDYAHVVLRGNGQTLSLFAEPAVRGALPTTAVTTMLAGDALDVHSTTRLGYRVSATATPEHRLFLVSDRPTDTPDDITNEILLSAVRFVRTLER